MTFVKVHFLKFGFLSTWLFCTCALFTPLSLGQEIFVSQRQTLEESIVQKSQGSSKSLLKTSTSSTNEGIQEKITVFSNNLKKFKEDEIDRRRGANQKFSIAFIVLGITFTVISTALGTVESQNVDVKRWTKFAIGLIGAMATAFQALNASFPVTKRAAEYAAISAEITILEFKINDVKDDSQLQALKEEFYGLIKRSGDAESNE